MWRHIKPIFASHHTRNCHVGFLLAWHGIGKYNKMFPYFLFSPYYNTKLQQHVKNISTHTRGNFESFCEVNQKIKRFVVVFSLYRAIQKGNQVAGQNCVRIGAYCVVQTLYCYSCSVLVYHSNHWCRLYPTLSTACTLIPALCWSVTTVKIMSPQLEQF